MAYRYLTIPDFSNRVRSLVNTHEKNLSDESLNYYENAPSAENYILEKVSQVVEDMEKDIYLDENKCNIYETCIVIKTALNAYPAIKLSAVKTMQTTNSKVEYFEQTADNESNLYAKLNELLALLGVDISIGTTYFMLSNDTVTT